MTTYLLIGLAFWAILSAIRWRSFKGASFAAVARGFGLGVFLWPLGIVLLLVLAGLDTSQEK